MLKTISAALLAASVLAAPAFAATSSQAAPVAKAATAKHRVLNAHARMDHQVSHHRRHRHHHKMAARREAPHLEGCDQARRRRSSAAEAGPLQRLIHIALPPVCG